MTQRPKVVHVTTVHPANDIRIFFKECVTLVTEGFDVTLIAPGDMDGFRDGVVLKAIPKAKGRVARFLSGSLAAYRRLRESDARVCHLHDPELLPLGQFLRWRGWTVVFDMHENVPLSIRNKSWIPQQLRALTGLFYRMVERTLLHGMPVVFAEESYSKYYPFIEKSTTLLNYPFASLTRAYSDDWTGSPAGELQLGYIGGVSSNRGADLVMDALERMDAARRNVTWHCVGQATQEYGDHLRQRASTLSCVKVRFYGRLSPHEGWGVMAKCDVGLAVLKPIGNYFESYPTKMFEYMAIGIPAIVSDFPLYRNVVESAGCGICVDPSCVDQLVAALERMEMDRDMAHEMGRRGQKAVVEKYNWEVEARKLIQFYRDIDPARA